MADHKQGLMATFFLTILISGMVVLMVKFFFDYRATKKGVDTSDHLYINLSNEKKWAYIQCYPATLMAILTVIFGVLVTLQCDPPEGVSRPDEFLGDTFFRNTYCRTHTNYY